MLKNRTNYYLDLIKVLVIKELKVRYKNTIGGYLWSVANPLVFALTFFIAFRHTLKVDVDNYILYLLAGLFPWQFFANAVNQAPSMFLSNACLIKKVIFPRYLLIIGLVGNHAVHFFCTFPIMLGLMLFFKTYPTIEVLPGVIMLFISQTVLIVGLSLFLSTLNLFFRDMENLTMVICNLLFYLSPVLYKLDMIPAEYQTIIWLNPMTVMVELWHEILLNSYFNVTLFTYSSMYNIGIFLLGIIVYNKMEKRFAEVV
ncbi:ABC transporter permease [Pectinatus haikarae]|uniref:Transport permease protein n=1 Tax=Pectinatus haikarae TaxID=349096 RepID=A0ABT9YCE4_9FIRM|nr:ABC transporter permease [Pectinatus haikarae]MDQ0205186.1 lipopolysaccharide transport system permease protein [Pectinatus haikarae]